MGIAVEVRFEKGDAFKITAHNSGVTLYADKKQDDYNSLGPNPLELFLSSLGSCVGTYAKRYLTRHSIPFHDLTIKVTADLSSGSPHRLVNITSEVSTDASLEGKKDIFLRFIENCPIHNTIMHTKDIDIVVRGQ